MHTRSVLALLCVSALAFPVAAIGADSGPDMSGAWSRLTFGFEPPTTGRAGVGRYRNLSNSGGNFDDPILKPEAAALVKQRSEMLRGGVDYPNPSLNCLPMV